MKILLKEQEAADYLRLKCSTLKQWQNQKKGPRFYRIGGAIRYDQRHLEEFINARQSENVWNQTGHIDYHNILGVQFVNFWTYSSLFTRLI